MRKESRKLKVAKIGSVSSLGGITTWSLPVTRSRAKVSLNLDPRVLTMTLLREHLSPHITDGIYRRTAYIPLSSCICTHVDMPSIPSGHVPAAEYRATQLTIVFQHRGDGVPPGWQYIKGNLELQA